MSSRRTKREIRRLKAELRGLLSGNSSDAECCEALGVNMTSLRLLKRELLADELDAVINDSPEEVWAKYRLRMDGCIDDLDDIISKGSDPKVRGGLSAATMAVKAKASIIDNVLKRGQDLGVVHKEPEKKVIIAGMTVTSASLDELRDLVDSRRAKLTDMVDRVAPAGLVDYAAEDDGDFYTPTVPIPIRVKAVAE